MTDAARRALGRALRELREACGLTQAAVGAAIGRSVSSVSGLETGSWRRQPDRVLIDTYVARCLRDAPFAPAVADTWRQRITDHLVAVETLTATPAAAAVNQLPRDTSAFTARRRELDMIRTAARAVSRPRVVAVHAVDGMPGVGKTAFAVHAAHTLLPRFPDLCLFLDLHGHSPGRAPVQAETALATLLQATGLTGRDLPDSLDRRAALWRTRMAGLRSLVILDNALDWRQIEPLLPGSSTCLVLVTSRRRLPIPDAVTITLDVLSPGDAALMLARVSGREFGPDDPVGDLVALAGHLPLALSLLGARLRTRRAMSVRHLVDEMRESHSRLALLAERDRGVAAAFDVSYRALPDEHQRFLRLLGLHPGDRIDAYAAGAIARLSPSQAAQHLLGLHDSHLLDEPVYGRFDMHDLIAEFVAQLGPGVPADDAVDSFVRLLLYFECTARDADRYLGDDPPGPASGLYAGARPALPDRTAALQWLSVERHNLVACARTAADHPGHLAGLVEAMTRHLRLTGPWEEAIELHRAAADAAHRIHDTARESTAMLELGAAAKNHGDYGEAERALDTAEELRRQAGGGSSVTVDLERGSLCYLLGRYSEAQALFEDVLRTTTDSLTHADALVELGCLNYLNDDYTEAEQRLLQALELYRSHDHTAGQAKALKNLGNTWYYMDRYAQAEQAYQQAHQLFSDLGAELGTAQTVMRLGSIQRLRGEYDTAVATLQDALTRCRRLGDRSLEAETLIDLGAALGQLGEVEDAATALQASVDLYVVLGEGLGRACALKEFAELRHHQGDRDAAVTLLEEARMLYTALPDRLGLAAVDNAHGRVALSAGCAAAAQALFERALDGAHAISSPLEVGAAHAGLGRVALTQRRPEVAVAHLSQAHKIFIDIGAAEATSTGALLDTAQHQHQRPDRSNVPRDHDGPPADD